MTPIKPLIFSILFTGNTLHISKNLNKTKASRKALKLNGINAIANIASEVNASVENIGARRLHTIIEKILDEISFTATDREGEKIIINKEYIEKNFENVGKNFSQKVREIYYDKKNKKTIYVILF